MIDYGSLFSNWFCMDKVLNVRISVPQGTGSEMGTVEARPDCFTDRFLGTTEEKSE